MARHEMSTLFLEKKRKYFSYLFLWRKKKNSTYFWLKKVPYLELRMYLAVKNLICDSK